MTTMNKTVDPESQEAWPKVDGLHVIDTGPSGRGASWWENLGRCPQRWAYDYLNGTEGRKPSSAPALIKGTLVHIGLAHFYESVRREQEGSLNPSLVPIHGPVAAVHAKARLEAGEDHTNPWHKYADTAAKAVERYVQWVGPSRQPEIIAVEKRYEINIPLVEEHVGAEYARYSCRVDLVAKDSNGKVWFTDHKTTSGQVNATKKQGFTLSLQFLGLMRIGRMIYGDDFGGTMINLVALTDKSGEPIRVKPQMAPWAVGCFDQVLLDRAFLLKGLIDQERPLHSWPKALTEQGPCLDRYGPCPYTMRCRFGPGE